MVLQEHEEDFLSAPDEAGPSSRVNMGENWAYDTTGETDEMCVKEEIYSPGYEFDEPQTVSEVIKPAKLMLTTEQEEEITADAIKQKERYYNNENGYLTVGQANELQFWLPGWD